MKPGKADAIGFSALVCVVGLAYFGLIRGQIKQLTGLRDSSAKLTRTALENDGLENVLEQDRADLAPLRERLTAYSAAFVGTSEVDSFLQRLAVDAETLGVSVSLLRPGEQAGQDRYRYVPITMSLEGRFAAIYELLRGVEYGRQLAVIEDLQVQGEPENDTCSGNLTINLFLKPEGKQSDG